MFVPNFMGTKLNGNFSVTEISEFPIGDMANSKWTQEAELWNKSLDRFIYKVQTK